MYWEDSSPIRMEPATPSSTRCGVISPKIMRVPICRIAFSPAAIDLLRLQRQLALLPRCSVVMKASSVVNGLLSSMITSVRIEMGRWFELWTVQEIDWLQLLRDRSLNHHKPLK